METAVRLGGQAAAENPKASVETQQMLDAIDVLERLVDDRGLLTELTREQRGRLLSAAGRLAQPGRKARRQFTHAAKTKRRADAAAADEQLLAATGIREPSRFRIRNVAPPCPFPAPSAPAADRSSDNFLGELQGSRNCYVCKSDFRLVHFFYDLLCPDCAEFNWAKRNQSADLGGRVALITGGRVKIGFYAALKLLRAGSRLVLTTRFPRDAASRFLAEDDARAWMDRLQIIGLDLRHLPSVEQFAAQLIGSLPRLDFVLNNACQTVRRPPGYYGHLMKREEQPFADLSSEERRLLESHQVFIESSAASGIKGLRAADVRAADVLAGARESAIRSQAALLPQDADASSLFPEGRYDEDKQQVDLRTTNSWRLKLADISTIELLEVQLVNASAPFVLNSRLKPLMKRDNANRDRHIVNVSAMEGVFYRAFKRDTHPHTNMAKAALNMMTRTSAQDYVKSGIHMNSVDTGWITDEDPHQIAERKRREHNFRPPLDHVDAAARICDPIFSGLNSGAHVWGKFLKDYQVANW